MKDRDAFSAFHPAVLCGYYALVLVFSMFLTHPLCLAASLLGALSYAAKLRGGRAVLRSLAWNTFSALLKCSRSRTSFHLS